MSKPYPVDEYGRLDMRAWAFQHCPDIHIECGSEFERGWDRLIHELLNEIAQVLDEENRKHSSIGDVTVHVGRIKGDRVSLIFNRYVNEAELRADVDAIMAGEKRLSIKADRVNGKSAVLRICRGAKKLRYHEVDELQQGLPLVIGIGLSRIRKGQRFGANSPVILGMNGRRFLNVRVSKTLNLFDLMKVVTDCLAAKRSGIYVSQVKEKFSTLRWYWSGQNLSEEAKKRIDDAISRADDKSAVTCEHSGGIGRLYNVGGTWRTRAPEFEQGQNPAYPFNRPASTGVGGYGKDGPLRHNVMDAGWTSHHVAYEEQFTYEGNDRLADGIVRESEELMSIALAILPLTSARLQNELNRRSKEIPADVLLAKIDDNRRFQKDDPVVSLMNALTIDNQDIRAPYRMADADIRIERLDGKVREVAVIKSGEHEGKTCRVREYGADWADVVDYLDAEPLGRVADDLLSTIDLAFYHLVGGRLSPEAAKRVKLDTKPGYDAAVHLKQLAGRLRLAIQQLGKKKALVVVPKFSGAFHCGYFDVVEETMPKTGALHDAFIRETKLLRRRMCLHQYAQMRLPFDRHAVVPMRNRGVVAAAVKKANHAGVKIPKPINWKPSVYMQMHTHRASFVTTTYANARSHILDEAMPQVVAWATSFVEAVEAAARKREIERPFSVPVLPDPVELAKFEESKASFFKSYGVSTGEEYMALKDKASKLYSHGYTIGRAFEKLKTPEGNALAEEAHDLARDAGGFDWLPMPNAAERLREIRAEFERLQRIIPLQWLARQWVWLKADLNRKW